MKGYDFRKWIEAGYRNYGEDPWFFIRELAQNSRDAAAAAIHVRVKYLPGKEEVLIFEDDGTGMTYDHAVRYLFRLYASSKTDEKYAAGMFGIGFWTVLKYEPSTIIIESRCNGETWGVVVDANLETRRIPGDLRRNGTRITLIRSPREPSGAEFTRKTREALQCYCSYLRRNNRRADPLPVFFSGENITREMSMPGPVSYHFKTGFLEGAVGLGPRPQVRLYARGLPVWEGTTLDELSHVPPAGSRGKQEETEIARGLAPVFLLNGSRLEVNISRRRVIDNRNLQRVRKSAEKALDQMVERAADSVSPRGLVRQFADVIKSGISSTFRSFTRTLLISIIIIIPLEVFLLTSVIKIQRREAPDTAVFPIQVENTYYPGASVRHAAAGKPPDMTFSPPGDTWFKLFTAEHYDMESGFMRAVDIDQAAMKAVPFPSVRCLHSDSDSPSRETPGSRQPSNENETTSQTEIKSFSGGPGGRFFKKAPLAAGGINRNDMTLEVELNIPETGKIFLPLVQAVNKKSVRYSVDPGSITINDIPLASGSAWFYTSGEAVISIPFTGVLRYRCCPVVSPAVLSPPERRRLTHVPLELAFPPAIEWDLNEYAAPASGKDMGRKVQKALALTSSLLTYDDSAATAKKYTQSSGSNDWFQRVSAIGSGDCDILNGVTVLFLRRMGVPARLVIGIVGREGKVLSGLHAWVEYFHNGRHIVDATLYTRRSPHLREEQGDREQGEFPGGIETGARPVKTGRIIIYVLSGLLFILLFFFFYLARRFKGSAPSIHPTQLRQVRDDLAGMVLHELLHPGAWGYDRGIRNFKLIPTITGGRIGLGRALKLAGRQKLFTIKPANPMARYLGKKPVRRGISILDAGNNAFAPVVKLLPGAIHLDKVAALQVVEPKELDDPRLGSLAPLVYSVNRILGAKSKNGKIPPCLLAPGLLTGNFLDVDLSRLPSLARWGIPRRFIAVNPRSSRIEKLVRLYQSNPRLAQFRFIRAVFNESNLVPSFSAPLLEKVSRQLLGEMR